MKTRLRVLLAIICATCVCTVGNAQVSPLSAPDMAAAISAGRTFATQARSLDLERFGDGKYTGKAGTLVAEGDSWFDYPNADVLKMLRRKHDYVVESVAHRGHTLDSITYSKDQLAELAGTLKSLKDRNVVPKAVLISAGGNDIAGPELAVMLNNSRSGLEKLDIVISRELISRRFQVAMITLLTAVTELSKKTFDRPIPILVHGYDYPIPDGRGFLGGFWFLPGPWLKPSFLLRSDPASPDSLDQETQIVKGLIDDFNTMLSSLPKVDGLQHVRYVKVIGTLSSDPQTYTVDWGNELHPTPEGFRRVAERFQAVLTQLP